MGGVLCIKGQELARKAIDKQVKILRGQRKGVLAGKPDAVHDMRVASRRFRVALNIFEPYLTPESLTVLQEAAREIGQSLGRAREIDVMVSFLEGMRIEVDDPWRRSVDHAITTLCYYRNAEEGACVRAADIPHADAFKTAHGLLYDMPLDTDRCARSLGKKTLKKNYKKVRERFRDWRDEDEDDHELHQVRIDLKKFRYMAEHCAPLFRKGIGPFIESLHTMQDQLGSWNDYRQLRDELISMEADAPYREAQGFPLIIRAYDRHAALERRELIRTGSNLFKRDQRDKALKIFNNPCGKCCD